MADTDYMYYGEMLDGDDVENAVEDTLRKYMNDYLGRWERKKGREVGLVKRPDMYPRNNAEDFASWPGHDFPVVLLVSPGLTQPPVKHVDVISTQWFVGVAAIALAGTREEASAISRGIGSACRSILLHHGGLLGFASGVTYVDERYDDLEIDDSRSIMASKLIFYVDVDRTADRMGGPPDAILTPDDDTPPTSEPPVPTVKEDGVSTQVIPASITTDIAVS